MNTQRQDEAPGIPIFDVRAFGAAGDGRTKDTAAIQAAIDRCAERGGGQGTRITDVRFSDFTMDCWNAFHIANSHHAQAQPPARIADLSFERFHIRATGASRIAGEPELPIRNLCFRDMEWRLARDEQAPRKQPWMMEAAHLEDCRFENIRGERERDAADVTEGFHIEASRDVTFRQIEFRVEGDAPFADGLPMGERAASHP